MVNQDIKATFGYLILLAAVVGVVLAFMAASYFWAVIFIVVGLLLWMIFVNAAKVQIHRQTGAILIIFGVLLAFTIFMAFGVEQDIWGGYRLKPEGATLSLVILLVAVMPGLIFFYIHRPAPPEAGMRQPSTPTPGAPSETPTPAGAPPAELPPGQPYEYPGWAEGTLPEGYEYYDPETLAAYYEREEEEDEEEEEEED
ncbi:MAG: hypothetical protein ACE5GH_06510 [Fidelibacterota bacterium]